MSLANGPNDKCLEPLLMTSSRAFKAWPLGCLYRDLSLTHWHSWPYSLCLPVQVSTGSLLSCMSVDCPLVCFLSCKLHSAFYCAFLAKSSNKCWMAWNKRLRFHQVLWHTPGLPRSLLTSYQYLSRLRPHTGYTRQNPAGGNCSSFILSGVCYSQR